MNFVTTLMAIFLLAYSHNLVAQLLAHQRASGSRPNIIFLMTDDQRFDAYGKGGNTQVITPNINKLADEGVRFTRCYSTSPICMPARATVMTGMYEFKTGVNFGTGDANGADGEMSADDWNALAYPLILKRAGYRIGFAGKFGFAVNNDADYYKAFDAWGSFPGSSQGNYHTSKIPNLMAYAKKFPFVDKAMGAFGRDFIRQSAKKGVPFCLSISFKAPHRPRNYIDPKIQDIYRGRNFSVPAGNYGTFYQNQLPSQARISRSAIRWDMYWNPEKFQKSIAPYYELITCVDQAVGMIRDELKRDAVENNTVIIFTSDNGYFIGSHGLGDKVLLYEEGARIPLIIYDPREPDNKRHKICNALVSNIDFAPTILNYAGIKLPKKMDGVSLLPLLNDATPEVRSSLLLVQNWTMAKDDYSSGLAVVTQNWKYLYWCYGDENIQPAEELYDLKSDPYELHNLVNSRNESDLLQLLRENYDEYLNKIKIESVPNPQYQRLGIMFDRHIPWLDKPFSKPIGPAKNEVQEQYRKVIGAFPK